MTSRPRYLACLLAFILVMGAIQIKTDYELVRSAKQAVETSKINQGLIRQLIERATNAK